MHLLADALLVVGGTLLLAGGIVLCILRAVVRAVNRASRGMNWDHNDQRLP